MCFAHDARPPALPAGLERPPLGGGAGAERLEPVSVDGTRFAAALASSGRDDGVGVVVVPDVRGLAPFYVELTERFAQAGHHAIALDLFARTAGTGERGEDFEYRPHVDRLEIEHIRADLRAARDALVERTGASAVVVVGFCLGGHIADQAATELELGFDGAVSFYGVLAPRFGLDSPVERAAEVRVPLLALFGGEDHAIPLDQVQAFERALQAAGADAEVVVYPGAPHSFFDRRAAEHAQASEDAWRRTLAFLAERAGAPR